MDQEKEYTSTSKASIVYMGIKKEVLEASIVYIGFKKEVLEERVLVETAMYV